MIRAQTIHAARSSVAPTLLALFALALVPPPHLSAEDGDYETPPTFSAKDLLPPDLLSGDHFRVEDEVRNDGFMNHYRLDSDYGVFPAYGLLTLKVRVREVHALDQLAEISKSDVFLDAVKRSAQSQAQTIETFAEKPVETMKGVPGGLKRGFRSLKRNAEEGYEVAKEVVEDDDEDEGAEREGDDGDEEEDPSRKEQATEAAEAYGKKYFGVTASERRWAQKLKVDPYTSNEVLRKEIKSVSRVDAATSFGMRFVPIPRIPGVDYLGKVTQLVWTMDPRELREQNVKQLVAIGLDEAQIDAAFNVPYFNPSHQTLITTMLVGLGSTPGMENVIVGMLETDSREHAVFFVTSLRLLAWYDTEHHGISEILEAYPAPMAGTEDGRQVVFGAFEYLAWTETLATHVNERMGPDSTGSFSARELWSQGGVSDRCRSEFEARGWTVFDRVELPDPTASEPVEG